MLLVGWTVIGLGALYRQYRSREVEEKDGFLTSTALAYQADSLKTAMDTPSTSARGVVQEEATDNRDGSTVELLVGLADAAATAVVGWPADA
jgi:hypothetical protein